MFEQIPETSYGLRKRIQFIYAEIEKRIGKDKRGTKILDIGCGTGELITTPLGSLGVSTLGIDIHLPSIEHAKGKTPFENVTFECTSINELAGPQFDFIICSELLEHLENPLDMLKEIKRKLKREGICIITIPNGYGQQELETRLYQFVHTLADKLKATTLLTSLEKRLRKHPGLDDSLSTESPHIQFFLSSGSRRYLIGVDCQ